VPAPPPAAEIVIKGKKTERELALERELKERETRLSELEDENRQLKTIEKGRKPSERDWGNTFFDE